MSVMAPSGRLVSKEQPICSWRGGAASITARGSLLDDARTSITAGLGASQLLSHGTRFTINHEEPREGSTVFLTPSPLTVATGRTLPPPDDSNMSLMSTQHF